MQVRAVLRREAGALWDGGKGKSLIIVAVTWGLLIGARMVLPVIIPYLQTAYGISLAIAGMLVSVVWFFGALGQLPGGALADRYPERTLMSISVIVVAITLAFIIVAPTTVFLFIAAAIWGLAHSLYPISRITFLSSTYADRLGSALGVTMATGDIGQTILPPVATVIAVSLVWQAGLGFVVPLLLVAGFLIYFVVPSTGRSNSASLSGLVSNITDTFGEMRTPAIGLMTVILFLFIFLWQSFTAFYPTYLMSIKGFSPTVASTIFGFFFAVGVIVKPLGGAAYDRIGMRASLIGVLLPPVVGFGLLPFIDSVWAILIITALISIMLGSGAITQSFLAESFPTDMQGTGLGVVRSTTAALGAGGPLVFGLVAEYGYFDQGYLALAAIMVVIIILTLRMPSE